ncbi:hypothetical protein P7H20_26535 [Paenibacillus larvae]|nr:hypothetical protein [Paenibacillus larvae]MDT2277687.1 hypothetical protein [Paenibacillus larvae]
MMEDQIFNTVLNTGAFGGSFCLAAFYHDEEKMKYGEGVSEDY